MDSDITGGMVFGFIVIIVYGDRIEIVDLVLRKFS